MKKSFVILSIFLLIGFCVKAQYVTIPDPVFKEYLIERYPTCFNSSQMFDTTCQAVLTTLSLQFLNLAISNWDGFQYFDNLQEAIFDGSSFSSYPNLSSTLKRLTITNALSASITLPAFPAGLTHLILTEDYSITNLPALPNSIIHLDCSYDQNLQSLPSLPSSLKYLNCTYVTSLQMFPAFPASLDSIFCSDCSLGSLPALPSTLKALDCSHNFISNLPSIPSNLSYLNCSNNQVASLPVLPASLQYLNAGENILNALPVFPAALTTLILKNNNLTALPAAFPPALGILDISGNAVQSGSVPQFPSGLTFLYCSACNLNSLPAIPPGVLSLVCSNNQLTNVPALPPALELFDCYNNHLTTLPALPATLMSIDCHGNELTSLPDLSYGLTTLNCSGNHISFLPVLPLTLNWLYCQDNEIYCFPAVLDGSTLGDVEMDSKIGCFPRSFGALLVVYDENLIPNLDYYSAINYPLCSAINNVYHCDAFPLMTGHVYYDNNNNSMHDANEPYKANANIQLSNGAFTVTNSNGYYQIPADSIGNYNITITPPNYFTAAPLQYNYNFNSYDTLVTGDFALHATTTIDSLNISVLPINWAARPGFSFPYVISYENAGTTTLSPNIVFNYDNTRLDYDSSSNSGVINSGSALSLAEPGFVVGDRKSFIGYFRVKPTAVIGDSIHAYVSIQANAVIAKDSTVAEIRGSYDPNDKSATPKLSPSQVAGGDYIYYSIRFQNTGTDTAFSVVITDTLNSQLQASTLQVINTSHSAKITVKDNVVYFEFINILLPDSNINELKSHGYVSFRIKPQPAVTLNSIIPNYAAIYFDYNSPVITNTALTNIVEPQGPLPLKLISFKVERSTGNKANAFWNTSNEINVQSYNIEMSVDGRNFSNIASEKAKGFQYNDYTKAIAIPANNILYFRLKMIDVDGRFTYSQIVTLRNEKSQSFSLLNNPVKNELNISIQDDALKNTTAKIYNAQGVLVKTILLQHDIENVNVGSLPAGIYYLVTEKGSKQFIIVNN